MLAEFAAVDDGGDDIVSACAHDAQLEQAVGKKNAVALADLIRQTGVGGADALGRAFHILGCNKKALARNKSDWPAFQESAGADFGPRHVGKDCRGPLEARGSGADGFDGAGVLLLGAVGEIQPRDVHACLEEAVDHLGAAAGGTEGTNDLGAAVA